MHVVAIVFYCRGVVTLQKQLRKRVSSSQVNQSFTCQCQLEIKLIPTARNSPLRKSC